VIENTNHIFTPYPAIDDLVEANVEVMPDSVSKEVDLGKKYGKAVLVLKKAEGEIVPCFKYKGKTHNIAEECGISSMASMASLAALDLDSDGNKEILYHDGECFNLFILSVTGRKDCPLKNLGCLFNNWEFFVTSDGTIVSMYGSQGCADMARLHDGRLEMLEQDHVDRLLIGSKGFHELEYIFEDNSGQCREYAPLLKTGNHIICKGGEMYGDHAMDIDLDGDGRKEQLYMGNPGWGATSFDIVRVNTRKESFPMVSQLYEDTLVFSRVNFNCVVKDFLQLSAVDVDADGQLEVVATGGTARRNSTYVMEYGGDTLVLKKHFVKVGPVNETDLR